MGLVLSPLVHNGDASAVDYIGVVSHIPLALWSGGGSDFNPLSAMWALD